MLKTIYWKTGILLIAVTIMTILVFTLGFTRITNAGSPITKATKTCSAKWKSTFVMNQNGNILKGSYADIYEKIQNGCDFKVLVDMKITGLKSFYCGTAGVAFPPASGMEGFDCRDSANKYAFRYSPDMENGGKSKVEYGKLNDDAINNVLDEEEIADSVFYVFTKS